MEEKKILNNEMKDEVLEKVSGGVVYVNDAALPEGHKFVCPSCGGDLRKEFYNGTTNLAYYCSACYGFPNVLKTTPIR